MTTVIKKKNKLNRFTKLQYLFEIIEKECLVLVNPEKWEDKNDTKLILEYKKRKAIKNILALCFSWDDENIGNWKASANDIYGCCIEFDKDKIIDAIKQRRKAKIKNEKIRHGKIKYRKIIDLKINDLKVDDIPFTKRWPYRSENEYRIIWQSLSDQDTFELPINISSIRKVTINPSIPKELYKMIVNYINEINEKHSSKIKIAPSSLFENEEWVKFFRDK